MAYELHLRQKHIYATPQELLNAAVKYFDWAESTPLQEEEVFTFRGQIIRANKAKVRPFTIRALAAHLGVAADRLDIWRKHTNQDWVEAMALIDQVIYNQKFENAAAGLLNATIISRDLGLAEKQEIGGIKDAPPVAFNISPIAAGSFLPDDSDKVAAPLSLGV